LRCTVGADPWGAVAVETDAHEGHARRALPGLAVAGMTQAGDTLDAQHLDPRSRGRPLARLHDLDIGRPVAAVQHAAAAVVDDAARSAVDVARRGHVMLARHDDAGRAGVHPEAPRRAAGQPQPDLRHVLHAHRAVGIGNVDGIEALVGLRRHPLRRRREGKGKARKKGERNRPDK